MTSRRLIAVLSLVGSALAAGAGRQGVDDPALRAAVEKYFAMQAAEDVDGYLALWSAHAQKPRVEQLKFVFQAGDDTFSEITILEAVPASDNRMRVRVTAIRERVLPPRIAGGPPINARSRMSMSLTYVREGEAWKIVREGPAVDGLAESLIEAPTVEEREQLMAADADLVNEGLVMALSRRASHALTTQAYAAAQLGFERMLEVARRVGNTMLEGEALQNLANSMYFQRNFAAALQIYEQRLAVERARDNQEGIAGATVGIATIRYSQAEYGAALAAYQEALAIQEKLGDEGRLPSRSSAQGTFCICKGLRRRHCGLFAKP
jgi:tetratricopeptide (TPR) repeat protein